jgi:hypothetical protein
MVEPFRRKGKPEVSLRSPALLTNDSPIAPSLRLRTVTPEVAGSSPVAPVSRSAWKSRYSLSDWTRGFDELGDGMPRKRVKGH